ncbi:hypothetical protein L6452_13361 [Arctium lappa]|uniref:Uncharacterized protein n=1 Tax=Arctium lappa TaxID=4217 RepID=A0ACB9CI25_ARCLA|nr:hypothetical protein L6452_13361 [Arctium lappa]
MSAVCEFLVASVTKLLMVIVFANVNEEGIMHDGQENWFEEYQKPYSIASIIHLFCTICCMIVPVAL